MRTRELVHLGFPDSMAARIVEEIGQDLMPVQEIALTRYGILAGGRIVISAPTSSGKSLLGELVAVHAGLRGGRTLILVPLRALAEERAQDMRARYAHYGLDILVTSRDHREDDGRIVEGRFHIAVAVYEKALSLILTNPGVLPQLTTVVADELQILGDPERGPDAEVLLTILRRGAPSAGFIALSAVVGNPEILARWMDAKLLVVERRPVPLRKGVLFQGVFRYRTDEGQEDEEAFPEVTGDTWEEMLVQTVQTCVRRGEQVLVFLPSRAEGRAWADRLSRSVDLPPAQRTIDLLLPLQETASRRLLLGTLQKAIAFHNGDLLSEERWAVESGARSGEIRVVTATTTLASGINMPAKTVIICPEMWERGKGGGRWFKSPIPQWTFEAMAGRAGRFRLQDDFGRAILLAPRPFHRDSLRRYLLNRCEPITPHLTEVPVERPVLAAIASGLAETADEVVPFLRGTLSGFGGWAQEPGFVERIEALLERGAGLGLLQITATGKIELMDAGRAVARSILDFTAAMAFSRWLAASNPPPSILELLFAACLLPDATTAPVPLSTSEHRSRTYEHALRAQGVRNMWEPERSPFPLSYEEMRGAKLSLVLQEWMEGVPVQELEERYAMGAGTISRAAEEISAVLAGFLDFAREAHAPAELVDVVENVVGRLLFGVRTAGLPLARLRVRGLGRDYIHRLVSEGLEEPDSLREIPLEVLARIIPASTARRLLARVLEAPTKSQPPPSPPPEPAGPELLLDPGNPGTIVFGGEALSLTPMEYRLLVALAREPGRVVPYDELYVAMWGTDRFVEQNQILYHKSRLLRKLQKAAGKTDPPPILTVTGVGLRLSIPVHRSAVGSAMKGPIPMRAER